MAMWSEYYIDNGVDLQSKGGHYFNNEERKDEKLTAEIETSLKKLEESIRARGGNLTVEVSRVYLHMSK